MFWVFGRVLDGVWIGLDRFLKNFKYVWKCVDLEFF